MPSFEERNSKVNERLKQLIEVELPAAVASVDKIHEITPPIEAEAWNRLKRFADTLTKSYGALDAANATQDERDSVELQLIRVQHILRLYQNANIIPKEAVEYFNAYVTYHDLSQGQRQGILSEVADAAFAEMSAVAATTTWAELQTNFQDIQKKQEELLAKYPAPTIEDLHDRALLEIVNDPDKDKNIDFALLENPGPSFGKLEAVTDWNEFKTQLARRAQLVDKGGKLRPDALKDLANVMDVLENDDALIFSTEKNILQQIRNLQAFIREMISRSTRNESDKIKWEDIDSIQGLKRPKLEAVEINGIDEVEAFLETVGIEDIDAIEKIALKMTDFEEGQKISTAELEKIKKVIAKLDKLRTRYLRVGTSANIATHPDLIDNLLKVEQQIGWLRGWMNFLVETTENSNEKEQRSGLSREPSLEGSQEKWEDFFLEIGRRPDGYEKMIEWGNKIMNSFYPSAEPSESWKARLETRRFSGWKDALDKISNESNRIPGTNPPQVREKSNPDFDHKWLLLKNTYDNKRLVIDGAITYAQMRSMTADLHSDEMVAKLGAESQALHGFTPSAIDFFTMTREEALAIQKEKAKRLEKQGIKVEPEKNLDQHYPHAQLVRQIRGLMKAMLLTPGSSFHRNGWKDDESSRNAMQKQLIEVVTRSMSSKPEDQRLNDDQILDAVRMAYTISTFGGLRLDTFAESYIAGDSPAGAIAKRKTYFEDACPPTGYLYAAYGEPKFLPELEIIYTPHDLIETWKAMYIDDLPSDSKKIDFSSRILFIEESIRGTQLVLDEEAPLRTESHDRPFGYKLERYDYDGMMKWQYPSLDRFLNDPYFQKERIINGLTFEMWAEGFKAFKDYRKQAHANLDCHGKSPDEAIVFLTDQLKDLINKVSALKTNMLVDWNYIGALMVMFVDRMYRAFAELDMPETTRPFKRMSLTNQINQMFGAKTVTAGVAKTIRGLVDPHAPKLHFGGNDVNISSNKLNTAGEIDLFRTFPPHTPLEVMQARYSELMKIEVAKLRAEHQANNPGIPFNEAEARKKITVMKVPYARAMLMMVAEDTVDGNTRRQMRPKVRIPTREMLAWKAFDSQYPGFKRTVKLMGQSTDDQKKDAHGKKE